MADSTRNLTGLGGEASKHEEEEEENDDYMGDLSQFIPPELTQKSKRKVLSKYSTLPYTKMCDFEFQLKVFDFTLDLSHPLSKFSTLSSNCRNLKRKL